MRLRPTRRLPGMLFAALVIYFFATNSQVIWLYLASALVAGLAVVGVLAPWLTVRRVHPRLLGHTRSGFVAPLAQDRDRVFAGDHLGLRIGMNEDRAPVELLDLRTHSGLRVPIEDLQRSDTGIVLMVTAPPRGTLRLATVQLASTWPLGIARAQREVKLDFEVVVHPIYLLPPEDRQQGRREPSGVSATRGDGEEFLGLREYRSGDSQRRVHWPTTARTGRLMVVETARESSNSSSYQLDLGPGDGPAVELAVQVAASLAAGNVAAGIPLTVSVPGQPRLLQRWPEVLGSLARARPGDPPPGRVSEDTLCISCGDRQVTIRRGDFVRVLDVDVDLEAAMNILAFDR